MEQSPVRSLLPVTLSSTLFHWCVKAVHLAQMKWSEKSFRFVAVVRHSLISQLPPTFDETKTAAIKMRKITSVERTQSGFVAISCATVLIKSFCHLEIASLIVLNTARPLSCCSPNSFIFLNELLQCDVKFCNPTNLSDVCVMMVNDNMLVLSCRWVLGEDHPVGGEVLQYWWWWTEGILHTSFWVFRKEVSLTADWFF